MTTLTPSATTFFEGNNSFTLAIDIANPGGAPISNMQIDWGDQSVESVSSIDNPIPHQYKDDGQKTIAVRFVRDGITYSETVNVTVQNALPDVSLGSVAATSGESPIFEGDQVSLFGTINDAGDDDTFELTVDWGDGNTITYSGMEDGPFEVVHSYANDETYAITATATDDDGSASLLGDIFVQVENAVPQIVLETPTVIRESDTLTLIGSIVDAGEGDTFDVTIDFGDGSDPIVLDGVGTSAFGAVISQPHTYIDDPKNTNDTYDITVTVTDESDPNSMSSRSILSFVENQAPVIESFDGGDAQDPNNTIPVGQPVSLTVDYYEPGILDGVVFEVNWGDGNGAAAFGSYDPQTKRGVINTTHAYDSDGVYPISVRIVDQDGGSSEFQTTTAYIGTLVNIAPSVSLQNSLAQLPEDTNVSQRTRVADIVVTDDGLGTNDLTLTGDDASLFELEDGVLYLRSNVVLNRDVDATLDVTVNVNDASVGGDPDDSANLAIDVTFAFNTPPVVNDQQLSVAENSSQGTVVGSVVANDADNDSLGYRIVSGNETGAFQIDPFTGAISVADDTLIDYELAQSYVLNVEVTDNGSPERSDQAAVTIDMIDDTNEIQIEAVDIDNGSGQHSMVRSLTVRFDRIVSIDEGAFAVSDLSDNPMALSFATETVDGKTLARIAFVDPVLVGGSLADGDYQLSVDKTKVYTAGTRLETDSVEDFYRLYGDEDGNGVVDMFDFAAFRNAFGTSDEVFDADGDGDVDLFDFAAFRFNYGKRK